MRSINKLSICSQIKNRLYQFKQTFEHNFSTINKYNNTEWIIVDIHSDDGLSNFIRPYVSDKINYFQCVTNINYSIPIAKNFAVRLSGGDYVFNLDVDNFLGSVIDKIQALEYSEICCKKYKIGAFGRIGCSKNIFRTVGGYDESFLPAGYHEVDLMERCKLLNYFYAHVDYDIKPIQNEKEKTIVNTISKLSWEKMNNLNLKASKKNIKNKIINPNKQYMACSFIHNFNKTVTLTSSF